MATGELLQPRSSKANDRKRLAQRAVYREFVQDWLPKRERRSGTLAEGGDEYAEKWISVEEKAEARARVLRESLERFEKVAVYKEVLENWRAERKVLEEKKEGSAGRREAIKREMEYAEAWLEFLKKRVREAHGG